MTTDRYDLLHFGAIDSNRDAPERNLEPGDSVRIAVLVNLDHMIFPWVDIEEATPTGYICTVGGAMNTPDWLPNETRVVIGFRDVIEQ